MTTSKRNPSYWPFLRDVLLFAAGMIGIAIETLAWAFSGRTPDPSLLVVFTAMLGLPVVLRKDEK